MFPIGPWLFSAFELATGLPSWFKNWCQFKYRLKKEKEAISCSTKSPKQGRKYLTVKTVQKPEST